MGGRAKVVSKEKRGTIRNKLDISICNCIMCMCDRFLIYFLLICDCRSIGAVTVVEDAGSDRNLQLVVMYPALFKSKSLNGLTFWAAARLGDKDLQNGEILIGLLV